MHVMTCRASLLAGIIALAACAPRLENRAGEIVTRTYTGSYQALADCTFRRLDAVNERVRKTEFPTERRVNLNLQYDAGADWSADFTADPTGGAKVAVPYPMTYAETHPDRIFRQVDICAGVIPPPNDPKLAKDGTYR
jgi:hypothetical protein